MKYNRHTVQKYNQFTIFRTFSGLKTINFLFIIRAIPMSRVQNLTGDIPYT